MSKNKQHQEYFLKDVDCAYLAGIVDGEGCIGIYRNKSKRSKVVGRYPRVTICNTNEWLIRYLHNFFGGSVIHVHSRMRIHKDSWVWVLARKPAIDFLNLILPYLHLKMIQAELAIQFYNDLPRRAFRWYPKRKDEIDKEAAVAETMHILNRKGQLNDGKD